jgi:DNA-binding transcriptional LysR family regulator
VSIKKYETLLKTVDLGSLTRASEELGYTQSAISQIISGLEEEMGLKLLIRDRSGVRLTEVGTRILPTIRAVCDANDEVYRRVAELHQMELGNLRIGTQRGVPSSLLPDLLIQFKNQHPDVHLELVQAERPEIERLLTVCSLDCALLYSPQTDVFEHFCIAEETLIAVFPTSRAEEPSPYDLDRLTGETFISNRNAIPDILKPLLKKMCSEKGIYSVGQDDYTILTMVAAGLGMSILPEVQAMQSGLPVVTRFCDPPLSQNISLVFPKGKYLSPMARQFIQFAKEC